MRLEKRLGGFGLMAVACVLGATRSAHANLMLTLSEPGYASVSVTDTLNTGTLSFFGSYGDFQTNFVAGLSNKLTTPMPSTASLQLQSINVKNLSTAGTTKTLTLTLTDDGYTYPGATGTSVRLDSSFGGSLTNMTAGDTVTFQSFVVAPSTTTGLQSYTAPVTDAGSTGFSNNVVPVTFTRGTSYDLQNVTTISLTGAYEQANLSGSTVVTLVPEPALAAVLAATGLVLSVRRARRQ